MLTNMLGVARTIVTGLVLASGISQFSPATAADADALTYESLFAPEKLLQIDITVSEKDWNALRNETRSMAAATARDRHPDSAESPYNYYRAGIVIDGVQVNDVGLRKKGFIGSLDRKRPSLKIHFGKFKKGRRIAGLEKLTLNNNKQDSSAMNQLIAYKIFRDAGVVAPRVNLARVTVNGTSLGIYSNVESIDDEFVKQHFEGKPGALYEGTSIDFVEGLEDKFETKVGKKGDYSDIRAVTKAAAADDDKLIEELGAVVDLEQFYRFWAVEALIQHWDGYSGDRNNFFIHRPKNSAQFTFIPWGADAIGTKNPFWQYTPPTSVFAASILSRRLYDHPEGRQRYRQTMRELLETAWNSEEILANIDRTKELIGEYMIEFEGFEPSVTRLKQFVAGRHSAIMRELNADAPDWNWPLEAPKYSKTSGTISGNFSTQWGTLMGNPFSVTNVVLNISIEGKSVNFKLIGATAGESQQPGDKGNPSVRIMARTEESSKLTLVLFSFPPTIYHPGVSDVSLSQVFGMVLEIDPANGGYELLGLLDGHINLDHAAKEKNKPVSGSFKADIVAFIEFEKQP